MFFCRVTNITCYFDYHGRQVTWLRVYLCFMIWWLDEMFIDKAQVNHLGGLWNTAPARLIITKPSYGDNSNHICAPLTFGKYMHIYNYLHFRHWIVAAYWNSLPRSTKLSVFKLTSFMNADVLVTSRNKRLETEADIISCFVLFASLPPGINSIAMFIWIEWLHLCWTFSL